MKKYVVRMSAGLANRMLQYSFYLSLKKKGFIAYVDNNYKATKWKMEDISWENIFPNAYINQAPSLLIFKYGGGFDLFSKMRRHYLPFTCSVCSLKNSFSIPTPEQLKKYAYIIGVMQVSSMIEEVDEEVKEIFKFTPFEENSNNSILSKQMQQENSVAIHVRKGKDYLTREEYIGTCTVGYYKKAIEYIESKVNNPHFYIFTDNIDWVKKNLNWLEHTLIDINPSIGWGNHFDMQLMSCCKHNIIANSTYSWWGAYLNSNPHKIVVGPQYWFNDAIARYKGLKNVTICNDWIAM